MKPRPNTYNAKMKTASSPEIVRIHIPWNVSHNSEQRKHKIVHLHGSLFYPINGSGATEVSPCVEMWKQGLWIASKTCLVVPRVTPHPQKFQQNLYSNLEYRQTKTETDRQTNRGKTRKECCRKETARCRSCSFRFKVRRQHSLQV